MAVISFAQNNPDATWKVANWIFRHLMDELLAECQDDSELAVEFEQDQALGSVVVYLLEMGLARRAVASIGRVVDKMLAESAGDFSSRLRTLQSEEQAMFLNSLMRLRAIIQQCETDGAYT